MSYLSPIPSHWIHSVHPSTNLASRAASPDHPRGVRPTNNTNSTLTNSNSNEHQLRDNAIERSNRFNSRSAHLPFRGVYHQRNRLVRAIHSKPPVATTVDADEVSDEEIALDNRKSAIARFGHKSIVAIGRRRTAYEEDISADEDNPRRGYADSDSSSEASSSLDGEGGPGAFVGGHTGHAAAQLQAAREAEARASEAVRVAQAERDRMQAQLDSLNRQRAQSNNANGNGIEEETMEGDRDLDADIEDLDD